MQPTADPAPEPVGPSRRWIWIAAVVILVITAAAVGSYLAFRPSGTSSPAELSGLLVDVPGKASTVDTSTATPAPVNPGAGGATGLRFAASRSWQDGQRQGAVVLNQFDSAGDAAAALLTARDGLSGSGTTADVPGLDNGFTIVSTNATTIHGIRLQSVFAFATKATILVTIYSNSDPVDYVRNLLIAQVSRLP